MSQTGTRHRRAVTVFLATVLAAVTVIAGGAIAHANEPNRTGQQERNAELVRNAFARGVGGENSFYSILAEDVQWTVARASTPTTYTSRSEFLQKGAGPILARLDGPMQADVRELVTENDTVVARWDATATARDGQPYVNSYVWVMTIRDDRVTRVTAYLDFVALDALLERVDPF